MTAFGQPTPAPAPSVPPATAPPSTRQGEPQPQQQAQQQQSQQQRGNEGFWGRFPTVPEDQRQALEPHLKTVQGYVTRMEQGYVAPWRGYTPQQVQGFAQFAKAFDANPLQSFLSLAETLQTAGVIHNDLDLQALAAVVAGQELPDEGNPEPPAATPDGTDPWADAPPWAMEIKARQEAEDQQRQEQARTTQEQRENAVLDHQLQAVKEKLVAAGFPEDAIPDDKDLIARFIVHNGSVEEVLQTLTGLRTKFLQGAVIPRDETVDLPRGVPPTDGRVRREKAAAAKQRRDPIGAASAGAEQFLRQSVKQAQQ